MISHSNLRQSVLSILLGVAVTTPSLWSKPPAKSDLSHWRVYTYRGGKGPFPAQARILPSGGIGFDFLETPERALFVTDHPSYRGTLLGDQTGGTISAEIAITSAPGTTFNYFGEGTPENPCPRPANVRFYFATRNKLGESAFWWSNPVSIDLAALNNSGSAVLAVPLTADQWSDRDGHPGNSDATHTAAFAEAVANIDQIGLSFGGGCFFAFGAGSSPAGATFELRSFSITR